MGLESSPTCLPACLRFFPFLWLFFLSLESNGSCCCKMLCARQGSRILFLLCLDMWLNWVQSVADSLLQDYFSSNEVFFFLIPAYPTDADCILTGCLFTVWHSGIPWGLGQDGAVVVAGHDIRKGVLSWTLLIAGPSEGWNCASTAWAQSLMGN